MDVSVHCKSSDAAIAVNTDGALAAFTVFTEGVGIGDGEKTDSAGNVFSTGGAGPGMCSAANLWHVQSRIHEISSAFGCPHLVRLPSDNLHELVRRSRLPVDGHVLGDIKLQPSDILLESSHVCVRSRNLCALSRWRIQVRIHKDFLFGKVCDQHRCSMIQTLHRIKRHLFGEVLVNHLTGTTTDQFKVFDILAATKLPMVAGFALTSLGLPLS